uniref:Centrosomal protein of 164 kDa n=2 Tax=Gouania willdenowi TaxID=441366 RepID=A0A8C5G1P3_GOUWI
MCFAVAMSTASLIGDQLILEEDYDDDYVPSEQEIYEYAREIGIDPDKEPELLWLAREGTVAPLPPEWKPCQDVTGDIYYFNFSSGQSTWDHPCDEYYRRLVVQERERNQQEAPAGEKKEKKKKKEKKEKKKNKKKEPLTTPRALRALPSPLGGLAPLRGLDSPSPALRRSLENSKEREPFKAPLQGAGGSVFSSVIGTSQEELVCLTLPGLDDDQDNADKISENEPSPQSSEKLLKNIHFDVDSLGGGLQYEESEASNAAPAEEGTEPELQNLDLSADHSPEPPSQQDPLMGRHIHLSTKTSGRLPANDEAANTVITTPPEFRAKQSNDEVDDELLEAEDESREVEMERKTEGGEKVKKTIVEVEDLEEADRNDRKKEEVEEIEWERKVVNKKQERQGEDAAVEEDSCEGKYGGKISENIKDSRGWKEEVCDKKLKKLVQRQANETSDRESTAENSEAWSNDTGERVGEDESVKHNNKDGDSGGEQKAGNDSDEPEQKMKDGELFKSRKKEVEMEVDEEGRSDEALGRCSLSQRRLTDSEEHELEQSHGSKSQKASESEDDASEDFKEATNQGSKHPGLEREGLTVRTNTLLSAELSTNAQDDLSGTASPLARAAGGEGEEEERIVDEEKTKKKENNTRRVQKFDRLLHQSSLSSPPSSASPSEPNISNHQKAHDLDPPLELQRPDTSRGRLVQTSKLKLKDTKRPLKISEHPSGKDQSLEEEERERSERGVNEELRRKSEQEMEEESERLLKEKDKRLKILQVELKKQEDAEEKRLKEENEEQLKALRQRLQAKRTEEESRLSKECDEHLQELRESARKQRKKQQLQLRNESEVKLKDMHVTLEDERAAEHNKLKDQLKQDMERLRAESEEALQAERSRLEKEREQTLNSLQQEVTSTEKRRDLMMGPRSEHHLGDYRREVNEMLQEVRDELQRDHDCKLEQLKDDHRREINHIREKHLDEETNQRERLFSELQEEKERIQASHTVQLDKLRVRFSSQIKKIQLAHAHEVRDWTHVGCH